MKAITEVLNKSPYGNSLLQMRQNPITVAEDSGRRLQNLKYFSKSTIIDGRIDKLKTYYCIFWDPMVHFWQKWHLNPHYLWAPHKMILDAKYSPRQLYELVFPNFFIVVLLVAGALAFAWLSIAHHYLSSHSIVQHS